MGGRTGGFWPVKGDNFLGENPLRDIIQGPLEFSWGANMNCKTYLVSAMILSSTALRIPAQTPQASPATQPAPAAQPAPVAAATPEEISVNVLGEVNRPSRILLPKGSTLLDAIASAGGITRIGNASKVTLIHKSYGSKPNSVIINMKLIMMGTAKDVTLRGGDTVVIGQTLF